MYRLTQFKLFVDTGITTATNDLIALILRTFFRFRSCNINH